MRPLRRGCAGDIKRRMEFLYGVVALNDREYLQGVSVRDLVESDAGKCEGLNFQFMLDEGYKVLECGDLYAIVSKSDYEGFGRDRICDAVYMEHSDVLNEDFLKVDFERVANDPEFNKLMEVKVSFVKDLPGAGEALYRSETGKHYIRQDNARERCAVWLSAFKHKGDWTDNAPIRPNVTFVMGEERERVSYSNWAGSGVWGEDYNEKFAKPSLDLVIAGASQMTKKPFPRDEERGIRDEGNVCPDL